MGKQNVNFDWITVFVLLCLGSFGLFLLLTINTQLFFQQFLFILVGFILLIISSHIEQVLLWWFAPIGYIAGNLFLILSYVGPHIRGATRWVVLGPVQLQPSELSKPLFLLAFSFFMGKYPPRQLKYIPLHMALFSLPFVLVFLQPDIGSSLVYIGFWVAMLFAGGLPVSVLITSFIAGLLLMPGIWHTLMPYQRDRILSFINPLSDPHGVGYNALQSMIAVGSGQLVGRGLGRGTQSHMRFLPEHHTDFIFATLVEELGFLGGLLLLGLYMFLLYRIIIPFIQGESYNARQFIYSLGLFAMLLTQIFINTGMNMGIIPITGITLHFVSYGGSSILSLTASFGILWALKREKSKDNAIAIM